MSIQKYYSQMKCHFFSQEEMPFRFLDLPLEIRMMVYEYALDFDSIDKFLKAYFEKKLLRPKEDRPTHVERRCHSLLLVNKEITCEALPILYATPLSLSYGILGQDLPNLIKPTLLRKLQHITISDEGSRHIEDPPHKTFTGYCFALVQLATHLRLGHNLKTLTISFKSPYVTKHLGTCLKSDRSCGIKSWVLNFRRYLLELHSIGKVIIDVDLPENMKNELIEKLQSKPKGFLALPFNIRKKIYRYAADYNDGIKSFRQATKDLAESRSLCPLPPIKTTPTILLINKQITSEAAALLYNTPLVISGLAPVVDMQADMSLQDHISLRVLKRIRSISIKIDDWRHLTLLDEISDGLLFGHKLEKFHLHFSEPDGRRKALESGRNYPDRILVNILWPLNYITSVKEVKITGSLPDCFARPLEHNMTVAKKDRGHRNCVLQAETPRGGKVDLEQLGAPLEDGAILVHEDE